MFTMHGSGYLNYTSWNDTKFPQTFSESKFLIHAISVIQ